MMLEAATVPRATAEGVKVFGFFLRNRFLGHFLLNIT
jgi:hypothetical protein